MLHWLWFKVLKIFTNILRHKKDILASSFNSHGGVYKVIELCQSKNSQISSVAWECFLEFNNSSETRASIGNAGGIQLLLSKLSSYPPNEMPQHLIDIMSGCSNDPSNRQHIKLSNALQFIIDVLKEVNSVKTKIQLLHTINHYYYDEESFVFMVKQLKLVDTLTHLLQQINEAIKASSEDTEQDSSSTEIHIPTNMQMNELSFLASDSFIQSADSSDGAGNTQSLISWMECHLLHLLSKISHIKSCLIYLASSDIFRALILYILVSRNPHFKCVKILQRISQDNACFEKLLRYGNIPLFYELCIHAESLPPGYIGISKLDMSNCPVYAPTEEYNLMDKITRTAETPYGMGVINSMLKGSAVERTTCVLSLPYLFRTHKRRFFHDFTGTVSSLINILSDPVDEEQFQQSIKAFSYLCEVLHKPIPTDLPHRLCLSPTSPPSQSPSSYSPPHDYNTAYMNSTPSQWYSRSPSKYMDDSGSELSSGALSDEDYSYDSSARRQYKLNRAIRPEVGSIEYCPPAKRPHIDTEASLLDSNDLTVFTEQNSNVCFYSKFNEKDFDFEFCVENKSFRVHVDKIEASSDVLGAMIRWARATSSGSCVAFTLVPAFIFESIIHQIYYCDYSCPTISNMLWPHDQDQNTDFQNPNDIQLKHINFLTDHATSLSPSMNILLKDVFKATQDQSSIFPGYHDPSSTSSSNLFTKFLHLLSLFFTTDILIMNYKTKVTTSLGRHISPNNAVALLVLSIEFHWCLLANKICRYIFRDICTSLRRSCIQQIMKYPQTVTDEIFEIFNQMIMEIVLK
ncbi:Armadillo repeat-containing protein 5-like [Oopsacas minuta]|uniref:Armadillo repeat-containing protein 5-like n=1 Tax=Oopsacas minuta TaxID=111878 RepID=A0AAV7K5Z6_9METZ|nr:Armadillo repeat-containing protein 5-like [Oopsacas minuta]